MEGTNWSTWGRDKTQSWWRQTVRAERVLNHLPAPMSGSASIHCSNADFSSTVGKLVFNKFFMPFFEQWGGIIFSDNSYLLWAVTSKSQLTTCCVLHLMLQFYKQFNPASTGTTALKSLFSSVTSSQPFPPHQQQHLCNSQWTQRGKWFRQRLNWCIQFSAE